MVETDAAMLVEAGHEVRRYGGENPAGPGAAGPFLLAPWNPRQTRGLARLLREWRPDVAHVHNTWYALSPAVVRVLTDAQIPTVVTFHNSRQLCLEGGFFRDGEVCLDCLGRVPWRGVVRGCYRGSRVQSATLATTSVLHRALGTWARADLVTVPSESLRTLYVMAGFDPDQIKVTPWSTADPGPRTQPPSASNEICFFGRLEAQKGVAELLDAWGRAGDRLGNLRLTVVGSGDLEAEVDATVAGLGGRVTRHVWMDRETVTRTMLNARAVVVPSICQEVFGFVAIEAMAAGIPVLASDRGALPETVGQVDHSLLIPAEDPAAWAEALVRLTDDELVNKLGRDGRAVYERDYSPKMGWERLIGTYENVLPTPSGMF